MNETIEYYNRNAETFIVGTLHADMSENRNRFLRYSYQQEILDKLEAERTVRGYTRNLVVAATGAHTIILTSQKDTEIRTLRTCLFFWPAAGSG